MEGWQQSNIGEICQIRPPKREVKEKLRETDSVSFAGMEALQIHRKDFDTSDERRLKSVYSGYTYFAEDDVIIAKITPCFENGKLGIARNLINGVGFGSSEFVVLRCSDKISPEFLFYFLFQDSFVQEGTRHMSGAVGHKRVPLEFIANYQIPLPALPEQHRIVAILDDAFEAIDKAVENTERNLENAREVFHSGLNDIFDRSPSQGTESWQSRQLNEVAQLRNGRAYKKSELLSSGKYRVLRVGNFFTNNSWYYSDLELDDSKYCSAGDLLYAWSASFGPRIWEGDKTIFHYHIWRVDFNAEEISKLFLFYWMLWDKDRIKSEHGAGTTMIHVSMKSMNARQISYPSSIEEQEAIVSTLEEIKGQTTRLEIEYQKKLTLLSELKQSLLHQAFTGELTKDFRAADRALEEAGV